MGNSGLTNGQPDQVDDSRIEYSPNEEYHDPFENNPNINNKDLISIIQRQRNLLIEYQQEVARVEMESEGLAQQIQKLENDLAVINRIFLNQITDWPAFEKTPTSRIINNAIFIKNRLFQSGGILERSIYWIRKIIRVIREEGLYSTIFLVGKKFKWFWYRVKNRLTKQSSTGMVCRIDEVFLGYPHPKRHTKQVDIIICVHNALEDVKQCLASIRNFTTFPYKLILVDDGSNEETKNFLRKVIDDFDNSVLLRSEEATGYTFAANRGLRTVTGDYAVLLNSDTIVGPGWIDRLISCAESDENIGAVGPISNTASWQSVPKIQENGDWATNPLPQGMTVDRMAELVANYSERMYPAMPLLNGFCLLLKKKMLDEVGLFDEEAFGKGYGEEDDLILRARTSGWKMALAEDTYIFHAQSKSYSSEKRQLLTKSASKKLLAKHGFEIIKSSVEYCANHPVLEGIRARAGILHEREYCIDLGNRYFGKRILFLLPSDGPGGGANVVIYEALAMAKMGVKVEIFNLPAYRTNFEKAYPGLPIPVIYGEVTELPRLVNYFDALVATHNETVYWLAKINKSLNSCKFGYYIQGFEPLMYSPANPRYKRALESYTLMPDLVEFTKTVWTQETIKRHTTKIPRVVGISLDIDLFKPRPNNYKELENRPLRIAAMIRPESPYREPEKTMLLLRKASKYYKGQVEPVIFGTTIDNPGFQNLPNDFPWKLYGVLSSKKVANLLNSVDIFIDYSSHQAMGLTALEAMATGCAVIVPSLGGAVEFCSNEVNSLIADTSDFESVWTSLKRLIEDEKLRKTIQRNAIYDVCRYFPEKAALNILNHLFDHD